MLGTLLFVGVKTAGPVMPKRWITMCVVQQDFLICKIVSYWWLAHKRYCSKQKRSQMQKVETGKQIYYSNTGKNEVIQIFSYNKNNKQNKLQLTDGKTPREKPNQLVLDEKRKMKGYKIGDIYQIDSDELKEKRVYHHGLCPFSIVHQQFGERIREHRKMVASIILSICLNPLLKQIFILSYILIFTNVKNLNTYKAKAYKDKMEQNQEKAEKYFTRSTRRTLRRAEKSANEELEPAQQKITEGKAQIAQEEHKVRRC